VESTPRTERTLKPHILVVDDEHDARRFLEALLAAAGYTVSTAQDGVEALDQLQQQTPDLIISDLNMSRMSGFELLKIVHHRFPDIPVIAASGDHRDGRIPDGLVADAFYAKGSHQPRDLLRTVAKLTSNRPKSLAL
jgi:CheY-like chemotaxis protein